MPSFTFTLTLTATPDPATFRASLTSAAGRAEGRVAISAALAAPIPSEKAALAERGAQLLMALRADPNLEGGLRAIVGVIPLSARPRRCAAYRGAQGRLSPSVRRSWLCRRECMGIRSIESAASPQESCV